MNSIIYLQFDPFFQFSSTYGDPYFLFSLCLRSQFLSHFPQLSVTHSRPTCAPLRRRYSKRGQNKSPRANRRKSQYPTMRSSSTISTTRQIPLRISAPVYTTSAWNLAKFDSLLKAKSVPSRVLFEGCLDLECRVKFYVGTLWASV